MTGQLNCARGHRWESPPGFPDPETNTCPVCGSLPLPVAEPRPWPTAAKVWLGWFIALGVVSVGMLIATFVFGEFGVGVSAVVFGLAWLVSLAIWANWFMERKRMLAMLETCKMMNFAFTEALAKKRLPDLGEFALFKRGHSHQARNLMAGQIGDANVLLFDYRYTTGHGKSQQSHQQTVVLLPGGAARLPDFQLTPATFMDKLGKLFGAKSIEFPDTPEFSRYRLTGQDETVRPLFTNTVRAYFTSNPGWVMESCDEDMLLYRNGKRCKPDACPELVATALTIRNLFVPPDAAPEEDRHK
jgi:hypothetical protein